MCRWNNSVWAQWLDSDSPLTACDFYLVCLCLFCCPVKWTVSSLSVSLTFYLSGPLIVRSDVFISSLLICLLQPYMRTHTHTELTFWPCNIGAVQIMIACIICGWQMCRPHQDDSLLTALINAGELSNQIEEIIEITHLHFTPYVFHKWYRFKREG